jgi:hypothetical protein
MNNRFAELGDAWKHLPLAEILRITYGDDSQAAANYPLVRITNDRTGHVFYSRTHDHISRLLHLALSALLTSICRKPKAGPTKPDNTQTGHVEIREVDIVLLPHRPFSNGQIQLRRQLTL